MRTDCEIVFDEKKVGISDCFFKFAMFLEGLYLFSGDLFFCVPFFS